MRPPLPHPAVDDMYESAQAIYSTYNQPVPSHDLTDELLVRYGVNLAKASHRYGMILALWSLATDLTSMLDLELSWGYFGLDPVRRNAIKSDVPLIASGTAIQVGGLYGGNLPTETQPDLLVVAPAVLSWKRIQPAPAYREEAADWMAHVRRHQTTLRWVLTQQIQHDHESVMRSYPLLAYCRQVGVDLIGRRLSTCPGAITPMFVPPDVLARFHTVTVAIEYDCLPQYLKDLADTGQS